MMVQFETQPQAPRPTIDKIQIPSFSVWNSEKHYCIRILFVDVKLGRKYGRISVTNQIDDEDMPYIYLDGFKVGMKGYQLIINNHSPLWYVLRKFLIFDGLLERTNDGAILIYGNELKKYLTDRAFKIQGKNIHDYMNVTPMTSGDLQ